MIYLSTINLPILFIEILGYCFGIFETKYGSNNIAHKLTK